MEGKSLNSKKKQNFSSSQKIPSIPVQQSMVAAESLLSRQIYSSQGSAYINASLTKQGTHHQDARLDKGLAMRKNLAKGKRINRMLDGRFQVETV